MKKVYILLADGFEEMEALVPCDILRRGEVEVSLVGTQGRRNVKGAHNIIVQTDLLLEEISEDGDMILLPGGLPGAEHLKNNNEVLRFLKDHDEKEKYLAAICAAPIALQEAGLLENKNYTAYPGIEKNISDGHYKKEGVVIDGRIITSQGPFYAMEFALTLLEVLMGEKKVNGIKEEILLEEVDV